jgi:signal peptidase I
MRAEAPAPPTIKKSVAREYLESLVVAFILATFIRTFVVQAFKIPTGSMENNLLIGDHLLVNKVVYSPSLVPGEDFLMGKKPIQRGHVIVFKYPEDPSRDFIKRVIALPGQTVEVHGGQVYVNGVARSEPYLDKPPAYEYGPVQVPEGQYFVLGDNRNNSYDSHSWGMLGESFMIGRAEVRYWPLAKAGRVDNDPEVAAKPQAGVLKSP